MKRLTKRNPDVVGEKDRDREEDFYLVKYFYEKTIEKVGEESDSSGSERSPKQAKRRNRGGPPTTRRRKSGISARERNLRRLESNERERMRMHSLNDAFEVIVHAFTKQSYPELQRCQLSNDTLENPLPPTRLFEEQTLD